MGKGASQEDGASSPSTRPPWPLGECLLKGQAEPPTGQDFGQTPFWSDVRFSPGDKGACKAACRNPFPTPSGGVARAGASLTASGQVRRGL